MPLGAENWLLAQDQSEAEQYRTYQNTAPFYSIHHHHDMTFSEIKKTQKNQERS
jgi:hypothetical protein